MFVFPLVDLRAHRLAGARGRLRGAAPARAGRRPCCRRACWPTGSTGAGSCGWRAAPACCSTPRWRSPASPAHLTVPHLMVVALLTGVGAGMFAPAEISAVRTVVPSDELPTALSQNQARLHVASLISAPLGGVLFSITKWLPFAADAVSLRGVLGAARPDPHRPLPHAVRRAAAAPGPRARRGRPVRVVAAVLPGAHRVERADQPGRERAVLRRGAAADRGRLRRAAHRPGRGRGRTRRHRRRGARAVADRAGGDRLADHRDRVELPAAGGPDGAVERAARRRRRARPRACCSTRPATPASAPTGSRSRRRS